MAKSLVEAAVNGPAGSNRALFFRGDQFVAYDWVQDRAILGAKSISDDWGLPNTFQPPGFAPRFDAAVGGREGGGAAHLQHLYFFHGPEYTRHDWTTPTPRPFEFVDALTGWKLSGPFADGAEAAFNGKGTRAGKTYFFKGGNYARYSWADDALDYVRQIGLIAPGTMPADFATGVDAAVDGDGAYANYGYLFKGRYGIGCQAPERCARQCAPRPCFGTGGDLA
jgi:hypothetical protein